jgi:iron complex outermembrane receptor protein
MKSGNSYLLIILLLSSTSITFSQSLFKGGVFFKGKPVPYATIKLSNGATKAADSLGSFGFTVMPGKYLLEVSAAGFERLVRSVQVPENAASEIRIELVTPSNDLNTLVIIGSRSFQRSVNASPLPIDVLREASLASTGQISLDKQLQYKLPSFNTANIAVSDATTFFDPYELRNLGASRTLVLINGKRKNPSSLLNLVPTVGRGETGVCGCYQAN